MRVRAGWLVEPMTIEQRVGARLRSVRLEQGLTLAEVGRRVSALLGRGPLVPQAIHQAEHGDRRLGVAELVAFAAALDTTVGWLVGEVASDSEVARLRALVVELTKTITLTVVTTLDGPTIARSVGEAGS